MVAAWAAVKRNEGVRPRVFRVGDAVLLERPPDSKPGHKMRPRNTGPWRISGLSEDGVAAELEGGFPSNECPCRGPRVRCRYFPRFAHQVADGVFYSIAGLMVHGV